MVSEVAALRGRLFGGEPVTEPVLQSAPAPTDAELQADRDRKHFAAVAEWMGRNPDLAGMDSVAASAYIAGWADMARTAQEIIAGHTGDRPTLLSVSERIARAAAGRFR